MRPGNVHSAEGWREVLEPVVARYRTTMKRRYFRADAGFASPEVYELLEAEDYGYVIRLPSNAVLQRRIAHLLKRPVGRPPHEVRRYYASFRYQAQTWSRSRRVVAKVEWHPGELYPRVGFLVTNLCRPPERVVAFYNQRGTAEQWIREGKNAVNWTRLSCRSMKANAVRLQLHALAYNMANFFRTLVLPDEVERWSLTTLREKVVKIGAKVDRSRALYGVPDGRGGGATRPIQAHPGDDRRTATKAGRAMLNPKAEAAAAIEEPDGRTVSEVSL